jgi:predicted dehydrogenase
MSVVVPRRVTVAGSGSIAQRHTRNLLALGVEEVLLWTARDVADVEAFSDARVRRVEELPADAPDVAVVANDTDRHVETARRLVRAGAHVLVEKPIATAPSDDLSDLCDEADAAGIVARVAYNLRLLPALVRVREYVATGAVGAPLFARVEVGQWLPDWRPGRPLSESYSASESRGGGVALDLSHEVDYMCMILGMPTGWCARMARTGALPIASPDVFDAIYTFANGSTCTVHMDYLEKRTRRRLRIVGTSGVIECDIAAGTLVLTCDDGAKDLSDPALFDSEATYPAEMLSFFAEIAGADPGSVRLPTLREGAEVLRLLSDGRLEDGPSDG